MERRSEPRLATQIPAVLTTLSGSRRAFSALIENQSGRGMQVRLECHLDDDTLVMVEYEGALIVGEICYCRPLGSGFQIGLVLEQVLRMSASLGALAGQVGPSSGSTKPSAPTRSTVS